MKYIISIIRVLFLLLFLFLVLNGKMMLWFALLAVSLLLALVFGSYFIEKLGIVMMLIKEERLLNLYRNLKYNIRIDIFLFNKIQYMQCSEKLSRVYNVDEVTYKRIRKVMYMKRGQILEVFIEDTKYPSIGIAKVENKTIEIKNAIVGAKVLVRITKNRKEKAEGKILEVLQYPEESIEPICPHSEECGGCSHQRIPYETQLRQKEREVLKLFEDAGIKGFKYEGIEKSPLEFEYRNKMEFTFGNLTKGGEMTLGMHQSGKFYNIIPIEQCKIADNDYNIILRAVSDYCRRKELPFYNKMNHEGYLRYLVIRKSFRRKELLVNIITTTQMEHDFTELADELLKLELDNTLVGFLHTKRLPF